MLPATNPAKPYVASVRHINFRPDVLKSAAQKSHKILAEHSQTITKITSENLLQKLEVF